MRDNKLRKMIEENQKLNPKETNRNVKTKAEKEALKAKKKAKKVAAMMAFAAGKASVEAPEIKRYIGLAGFNVVGVCPTKEELTKIYGRETETEPVYLGEYETPKGKVAQARIDVVLKADGEKHLDDKGNPINLIVRKSFYIADTKRYNHEGTKLQVIDKYGRTAWVTEAQLANHEIPMYKNGLANLDKDYRPIYLGEDTLTDFLIAYLNIPGVMKFMDNTWKMVDGGAWCNGITPDDCLARLEHLENLFKGDFSEVKGAITGQPLNKVKALIGVKSSNGKMYQDVFDVFMKYGATNYSKLEKALDDSKAAGRYANTEFKVDELSEYTVNSTNLSEKPKEAAPNPFEDLDF